MPLTISLACSDRSFTSAVCSPQLRSHLPWVVAARIRLLISPPTHRTLPTIPPPTLLLAHNHCHNLLPHLGKLTITYFHSSFCLFLFLFFFCFIVHHSTSVPLLTHRRHGAMDCFHASNARRQEGPIELVTKPSLADCDREGDVHTSSSVSDGTTVNPSSSSYRPTVQIYPTQEEDPQPPRRLGYSNLAIQEGCRSLNFYGESARGKPNGFGVTSEPPAPVVTSRPPTLGVTSEPPPLIVYKGDWKHAMRDGTGTAYYRDGSMYIGTWRTNLRNGRGVMFIGPLHTYKGEVRDDKVCGRGVMWYANGDTYIGEWQDNMHHGQGTYIFAKGGRYEGQWVRGHRNGEGRYQSADGGVYVGDFKNDKRDGKGRQIFADGDIYEGDWKDNLFDGQGVYKGLVKDLTYTGGWSKGLYHGYGELVDAEKGRQSGTWEAGVLRPRQ